MYSEVLEKEHGQKQRLEGVVLYVPDWEQFTECQNVPKREHWFVFGRGVLKSDVPDREHGSYSPIFIVGVLLTGMSSASDKFMSELTRYNYQQIEFAMEEAFEKVLDHLADSPEERLKKIKEQKRNAGKKYAKKIGLRFNEAVETTVRNILCEKIIEEMHQKKITHQDLARCLHASRSKVTCVMNRKLKGISIGFMVRLLMALGTTIQVTFQNSK